MENPRTFSAGPYSSDESFTWTSSTDTLARPPSNMSNDPFQARKALESMPAPPDDAKRSHPMVLGQLSYAPATQTTIVTTTTTTTTNFPPLIMKAPKHLNDLDPKLYPLADSPTPASMRRFHFNAGGQTVLFEEAKDSTKVLREV